MNDVVLDGPRSLYLPAQHIAIILDSLAEGKFKVTNPVITLIMQQLREQEPKKEINREEIGVASAPVGSNGVQHPSPADR